MHHYFILSHTDLVIGGIMYSLKVTDLDFVLPQKNIYDGRFSMQNSKNNQHPDLKHILDIKLISCENDTVMMLPCSYDVISSIYNTGDYILGRTYHEIFEKIRGAVSELSDAHNNKYKYILKSYLEWLYITYPEYII